MLGRLLLAYICEAAKTHRIKAFFPPAVVCVRIACDKWANGPAGRSQV